MFQNFADPILWLVFLNFNPDKMPLNAKTLKFID